MNTLNATVQMQGPYQGSSAAQSLGGAFALPDAMRGLE
jgi:hypothetical protein